MAFGRLNTKIPWGYMWSLFSLGDVDYRKEKARDDPQL